jgi:DNA mismatch repair protein MutS2
MQHFTGTLDIRGKRGDDAIKDLDQYLDEALVLNMKEVKILHGKGDGILRKLVREQLKRYSFIEEFMDEHADRGGAGITLVRFK